MSRRVVGILMLLGLSLLLGVAAGEFFFRLWDDTVPPASRTSFHTASAHAIFLWRGFLLGFAFFAWGLLAPFIALMFRPKAVSTPAPARPSGI